MSRPKRAKSSRGGRAKGGWSRLFERSRSGRGRGGALVGTDFAARYRDSQRLQRLATPLVVLGLLAALGLTALRNDIVRMEYGLAEAGKQEQELLDRQRRLTVDHRQLLAPARLYEIARERGFVRPARVIDMKGAEAQDTPLGTQIAASVESRP